MVTLQEFGYVEENVLNPNYHLVPESNRRLTSSDAPERLCAAERVQIENTLFSLSSRYAAPVAYMSS